MEKLEFEIEKWKSHLDDRFHLFIGYYEGDELKETARHFFKLGIKSNQSSIKKDMDKKIKFMFRAAVVTAALSAIAFVILGSTAPVEAGMSMFGHWLKTFFMYCWVTVILETFVYVLGQVAYHWMDDYKDLYGKNWFIEGIKDDWRSFKAKVTWKKVLKYVLIFVGFFAVCLGAFYVLELLVP